MDVLLNSLSSFLGQWGLRPIALCNSLHKIIAKIITIRIKPMLVNAISGEQFGFVKGLLIHEAVGFASSDWVQSSLGKVEIMICVRAYKWGRFSFLPSNPWVFLEDALSHHIYSCWLMMALARRSLKPKY